MSFQPDAIDRLRRILPQDRGEAPDPGRRPAAVLVPLCVRDGGVHVVLTRRSARVRHHRGEVSFPGGGWEPHDPTLARTALRESEEEIGLRPDAVELLGVLDDMATAVSGYVIRPFVARIPYPYRFVPDPREVERVFVPPLAAFADPTVRREEMWERDGRRFPMVFHDVDGETVWGATARLLDMLLARLAGRTPDPIEVPGPSKD